jgi:hypothetical protein
MSVTALSRAQVQSIFRSTKESALPEPAGDLQYRIEGSVENPKETQFSGELFLEGKPVRIQFTLVKPTLRRNDFPLMNTPFRWIQEFADASLQ